MSKLADNLKNIHTENTQRQYIHDWRDNLPKGSLWAPGSHGDPACKKCLGTGWLRTEHIAPGMPGYGKLEFCDCVPQDMPRKLAFENSPEYHPTPKETGR